MTIVISFIITYANLGVFFQQNLETKPAEAVVAKGEILFAKSCTPLFADNCVKMTIRYENKVYQYIVFKQVEELKDDLNIECIFQDYQIVDD